MENKKLYSIPKKRRIKDITLNSLTGLSSLVSIVILLAIILFVFIKGVGYLDFRSITQDYYETPYFSSALPSEESFGLENKDNIYYSNFYGIGLKDEKDLEGNPCVTICYIEKDSPLKSAKDINTGETISISLDQIIKRVQIKTEDSYIILTTKAGAKEIAASMDLGIELLELYYATMGGGIRGSLLTTILLIVVTLILSIPIGVLAAVYFAVYAKKNRFTRIIRSLIDMIAGIPSIIFGLIGVLIFIPVMSSISGNSGGSIASGALTLSLLLLPTIITTTEESILNIPKDYKLSSLALGASETQTTFKVILPNAIPGILTSILLSVGRIIGESAALIFAIGTAIQDQVSLFSGGTPLAVHIWTIMAGENPNYGSACAISIIILIVVLLLNIGVKLICKKLNKFEVK